MEVKLFVAAKAFVIHDNKVLILRESIKYNDGTQIGKYGEVGGRITPGEFFNDSLLREVREETGLNVQLGKPFHVDEWRPVKNNEQWHIIATFFECFADSDNITLSEDHDKFEWIDPKEYKIII
ncbi:MAG: NUDIX domain-containing protein [Nanoarchaeota archaeon]